MGALTGHAVQRLDRVGNRAPHTVSDAEMDGTEFARLENRSGRRTGRLISTDGAAAANDDEPDECDA